MTNDRCKICREPERRRLIEADWSAGMSAVGIAARMTAAGWQITGPTVLRHLKEHAGPGAATRLPPALPKRDAAVFIRDRIMDRLEALESEGKPRQVLVKDGDGDMVLTDIPFDILDKDLQPAIGSMLKAQDTVDKRERTASKTQVGLLLLMLGIDPNGGGPGPLAPASLTAGEDNEFVIEGEFSEVE